MDTPPESPPVRLWRRAVSALHGEVSAESLEAFRAAGSGVYEQYLVAERARAALAAAGTHPWSAEPQVKSALLCTWNAHVLQALGSELLDADYRAKPSTRGFVPPVTAQQSWAWFSEVEPWLSAARQADLGSVSIPRPLPADLPSWVVVDPCPPAHLEAMLTVAGRLDELLEADLATVMTLPARKQDSDRLVKVRQLAIAAHNAVEYCQRLGSRGGDQRLHELIESRLHRALETQFHLGQLLADPSLIDEYVPDTQAAATDPSAAATSHDPWCLTDPRTRAQWQRDPKARQAIAQLWNWDPDSALTRGLAEQVSRALDNGDVSYAKDEHGTAFGNYYCCPWSAIYVVRHPLKVLGRRLQVGEQFTLDVSAEEIPETGQFVRRIVTGPFAPTTKIDYCDPSAEGHDE